MSIHPTAVIHPRAIFGDGVRVGPYATIEEGVCIGDGCEIGAYASVKRGTTLGRRNRVFDYASVGGEAQHTQHRGAADHSYSGMESFLTVGDDNIIRENVTIHRASIEGAATRIGSRNYFMAGAHVAHDCEVGDDNTFVNSATLAGHVRVEDHVFVSGFAGVQQFVRVGRFAMVAQFSKITRDVPPFVTVDGNPARVRGLNTTGLRRGGFATEDRRALRLAYTILFRGSLLLEDRLVGLADLGNEHVNHLARFIRDARRGFTHAAGRRKAHAKAKAAGRSQDV
jgi:UDP-N-acetylglucosamine acyltransferase